MTSDPHAFLQALAPSTMKFGLDRMRAADAALGQPWRGYRTLHVAGTNGKGSTCAFAEAIFRAAGLRVGLYSSPHLDAVNERIRVDGRDISDAQLAVGIEALTAAYRPGPDDALTYFEFLTALALWFFREERVDIGIIEVGLGGRFDATNVITPSACAIATIGLDHTEYLGETLGKIAAEKAGILKSGVPAAVLTREPEALGEIRRIAGEVGAPLRLEGDDFRLEGESLRMGPRRFEGVALGLAGAHQKGNAALAAQATLLVEPALSDAAIRRGLAEARWPGRMELLDGVLLDGAHNLQGAEALAAHLATLRRPVFLVFGALADKDVAGMVGVLAPAAARVFLVAPESPRALAPEAFLEGVRHHAPAESHESLASALAAARRSAEQAGGQVVVAGSLYLIGPMRRLLSNALGAAHHAL